MSTSAAAGAAGGRRFAPLTQAASGSKVAGAVVASGLFIYAVWEVRLRAAAKAGKVPRSMTADWRDAERRHLQDFELLADPERRVFMNPHRHNVGPKRAVHAARS